MWLSFRISRKISKFFALLTPVYLRISLKFGNTHHCPSHAIHTAVLPYLSWRDSPTYFPGAHLPNSILVLRLSHEIHCEAATASYFLRKLPYIHDAGRSLSNNPQTCLPMPPNDRKAHCRKPAYNKKHNSRILSSKQSFHSSGTCQSAVRCPASAHDSASSALPVAGRTLQGRQR